MSWRLCRTYLPDRGIRVLASTATNEVVFAFCIDSVWRRSDNFQVVDVVAWRKVPKPYGFLTSERVDDGRRFFQAKGFCSAGAGAEH